MEITHQFLSLKEFRGDDHGPRALVSRKTKEEVWYTPLEPVRPGVVTPFTLTRSGESVLIRLQRVVIPKDTTAQFAFIAGLAAKATHDVPAIAEQCHIVIGRPIEATDEGEVVWLGFGFRAKNR